MAEPAEAQARRVRFVLWLTLVTCGVGWGLLLWHPWIDWFGRPR